MDDILVNDVLELLWKGGYDTGSFVIIPDCQFYLEVFLTDSKILIGPVWGLEDSDDDVVFGPDDLKIFEVFDSSWSVLDGVETPSDIFDHVTKFG